jgi:DNA replication protein DnaD
LAGAILQDWKRENSDTAVAIKHRDERRGAQPVTITHGNF